MLDNKDDISLRLLILELDWLQDTGYTICSFL